ncbi:MAG TPA: methyltransferase domain-containing protein, partial [Polyangiaceae bacterium]|nr:methyltransferase domain-containing protein [Polyangiaceae bacterium]
MVSLTLDTPELAAQYDIVGQRQFSHGKLLVHDLDIRFGQRVLDLGAGTGLLAAYVASIVGATGKVTAVDPLPLRVALASKKAAEVEAKVGRAEDLSDFAASSFDVVYLNSVIHWIADKRQVLAEIQRVLKPGGKLGFTTAAKEKPHDVELFRQRALEQTGLQHRAEAAVGIPHKVSSDEVRELFAAGGYRTKQVQIRTIVDYQQTANDVYTASLASSFGNHLAGLSAQERDEVQRAFGAELEKQRDAQGIRLERHLIFAVAEKPQIS